MFLYYFVGKIDKKGQIATNMVAYLVYFNHNAFGCNNFILRHSRVFAYLHVLLYTSSCFRILFHVSVYIQCI